MIAEAGESDEIEHSVDMTKSEDSNAEGGVGNGIKGASKPELHPAIGQFVQALGDKLSQGNVEFKKARESVVLVSGNDKHRKLLTDYTLAMLNYIPATILQ